VAVIKIKRDKKTDEEIFPKACPACGGISLYTAQYLDGYEYIDIVNCRRNERSKEFEPTDDGSYTLHCRECNYEADIKISGRK
jgi:hypothetical protein